MNSFGGIMRKTAKSKMICCIQISIIVLFFTISFIPVFSSSTAVNQLVNDNTTLYVGGSGPGNYSTIQEAINHAVPGDSVFVYSGFYQENLIVDKSISLIGENSSSTIIDGGNSGDIPCIDLIADNVLVQGFLIQWSDWEYHEAGIRISSNYFTIRENNISIHDKGIVLFSTAKYGLITENIISENHEGIYIWPTASDENTIEHNYVGKNDYGFKLLSSNKNTIVNNTIEKNNWYGVLMKNSDSNVFSKNTFYDNAIGISLDDNCMNNTFYHNNFVDNNYQAIDTGLNTWNATYPIGGNYWNDYNGSDMDGDGIGDQPYSLLGQNSNIDYYPFITKNGWITDALHVSVSIPEEGFIDQPVEFSVRVSGGKAPYDFMWDFGDNHSSQNQNPVHTYQQPGEYTVSVFVSDQYMNAKQMMSMITIYPKDTTPPELSIISPKPGVYIGEKQIFSFNIPFSCIFGDCSVYIASTDADSKVSDLNVYIDDALFLSSNEASVSFLWPESKKGKYELKAEAVDLAGNINSEKLTVFII